MKRDEPKPEDLPVLRSPLASESFGRLHLRKTGRGSGDSRASVLAQHFRFFYAGVFERPENEPHCISQLICPPFADRFFYIVFLWFLRNRKEIDCAYRAEQIFIGEAEERRRSRGATSSDDNEAYGNLGK